MKEVGILLFVGLFLLVGVEGSGSSISVYEMQEKFDGVWETREDEPDDAKVTMHVCVVQEEEEEEEDHKRATRSGGGGEHGSTIVLYAKVLDRKKGEISMLRGELHEIDEKVDGRTETIGEFQGVFVSGGYPVFSGPGYDEDAHCFLHQFRWSAKEIVFRCNSNDYHEIRLSRLSDEKPSDRNCLIPSTTHSVNGHFSNTVMELSVCVDGTLNHKEAFRVRASGKLHHDKKREEIRAEERERKEKRTLRREEREKRDDEVGLEDGYLEGMTIMDGIIASGQYYEKDTSKNKQGKKVLILRRRNNQLMIIVGQEDYFFSEIISEDDHDYDHRSSGNAISKREEELECQEFWEYAPSVSGTYEPPIAGLPEIFVCENDGILTAMYSYVGVFIGEYNKKEELYEAIWAESGYNVQHIMGSAELRFSQVGVNGEAVSGDNTFSLAYYRLSRGMPPSHLCMAGALENLSKSSTLEGTWGVEPETTLAICIEDDEESYHLSYGFADEDNSGGFETGHLHNGLHLSSGVFEEPEGRKGFSLSVQRGDDEMYNIYVYNDDLEGFTEGFGENPLYGIYLYERKDDKGKKCDYYEDGFSGAGTLEVGIVSILLTFFLFLNLILA